MVAFVLSGSILVLSDFALLLEKSVKLKNTSKLGPLPATKQGEHSQVPGLGQGYIWGHYSANHRAQQNSNMRLEREREFPAKGTC